jgi:RES domain-containing protein
MRLWRVIAAEFKRTPMSTRGAFLTPGRWHSAGSEVLYCAETESLAKTERFVHLAQETGLDFVLLELSVPATAAIERAENLPISMKHWDDPASAQGRAVGDWWLAHTSALGLSVPSVLSTSERDVMLRGDSADFSSVKVAHQTSFRYDPRMFIQQVDGK